MPLLVYRPRNYDQTHEREEFRNLCALLQERYASSPDEMCIFIGNFNIGDVELDGLIIKDEGVAVVEFKDYGGRITAAENGDWISEEGGQRSVIKGGSGRKNPYTQAKINRNACRPILSETGALTTKQASRLASMIVFHRSSSIENRISPHIKWLRVCDEKSFIDELDMIVSSDCDLQKEDFDRIIERLALDPDWLCVRYSNTDVLEGMRTGIDDFESLKDPIKEPQAPVFEPLLETKTEEVSFPRENESNSPLPTFRSYLQQVFTALGIKTGFEVFDIRSSDVPDWLNRSRATNEYLVVSACHEFKSKLEHFLYKKIFEHEGQIYWFDGDSISASSFPQVISPSDFSESLVEDEVESRFHGLKVSTRLPAWLDKLIYDELGARWQSDCHKFESNLKSTAEDNLVYLGTYFPRSYADAFCIFDDLFSNEVYRKKLLHQSSISVLCVGGGTGGDVIGLLTSLLKHFSNLKEVSLNVIDGNEYALSLLDLIVKRFASTTKTNVCLTAKQMVIEDFSAVDTGAFGDGKFDFIMSCKMISEIISGGKGTCDNAYYDFGKRFLPELSDNGVCLILDVTTKAEHLPVFYPKMLSAQINQLIRDKSEYGIIIPVCCGQYGSRCTNQQCFQQKEFTVLHSKKAGDKCRVTYRLLARKSLAEQILDFTKGKRMLVYGTTACSYTDAFEESADPYTLNVRS